MKLKTEFPIVYGTFAIHDQEEAEFIEKLSTALAQSSTEADELHLTRKVKAYGSKGTFHIASRVHHKTGKRQIMVNFAKVTLNDATIDKIVKYAIRPGTTEWFAYCTTMTRSEKVAYTKRKHAHWKEKEAEEARERAIEIKEIETQQVVSSKSW